jgi:putative DNA-invertase from lambdoid prophage Rac
MVQTGRNEKPIKPKKVALYCRVSTKDQCCQRQEQDLVAFAMRSGFEVVGVFKETASGSKDSRPVRKEVLDLARKKFIQSVLVTELSRWGRNTSDLMTTLDDLQSWGVNLFALNGVNFDLSTAQGRMMAQVLSSIAEFERDLIKERVISGLASARARGVKLGRQRGDFFKSDKIALSVLTLINQGVPYRTIANDRKINKSTVSNIVRRFKDGCYDEELEKAGMVISETLQKLRSGPPSSPR